MTQVRMPWKRILSTILRLEILSRTSPVSRCHQGDDTTSEQKALSIMTRPSWMGESMLPSGPFIESFREFDRILEREAPGKLRCVDSRTCPREVLQTPVEVALVCS